jgi:hypothetical protein
LPPTADLGALELQNVHLQKVRQIVKRFDDTSIDTKQRAHLSPTERTALVVFSSIAAGAKERQRIDRLDLDCLAFA